MSTGARVRVAIVGAGLMGRWHARAVARTGGTVIAVVDRDPGRAAALARECGAPARPFPSVEDAARAQRFDAAHVCVPLSAHAAAVMAALDAGAHVLVEKPLAPTAEETARLLDAAAAAGRMLCPVHQFPFQRGMREVLEIGPAIGPARQLRFETCSAGAASPEARDGVVADILPHPLSLFAAVLGAPLAGLTWSVVRSAPGELLATGASGGTGLSLLVSMNGRPPVNGFHVIGERGSAHVDLFHGFAVIEPGSASRARKITRPFTLAGATLLGAAANLGRRVIGREPAYPGLRELVAAFHEAIGGRASQLLDPARTLDVALARDAILRQASRE